MATTPNTTFTAGAILTAAQQNNFPRGSMTVAAVSSGTSYTLTTGTVIATGMTASWTAVANRLYKITYVEPQAETSTVSASSTTLTIRETSAAGTIVALASWNTVAAAKQIIPATCVAIVSPAAGVVTYVGCATSSSTTGTPVLQRNAFWNARLIVEDIGAA
jgi:hypothetical protein